MEKNDGGKNDLIEKDREKIGMAKKILNKTNSRMANGEELEKKTK